MNIPTELKYLESHEWIRIEGNIGTVGITEHAQSELSDVVFVDLPKVGKKLAAKDTAAVIESVKAASDIYSPVSGEVIEANKRLESEPALINTSSYGDGWLFKIKLSNPDEVGALKTADAYAALLKG